MLKSISAIIVVSLLFPNFSYSSCDSLEGLYKERKEITLKYKEQAGYDYLKSKERADIYKKQIDTIDIKYRQIINNLFFEYEAGGYNLFEECCDKDKYLALVCKLISYFRNKNSDSFLNSIPTQEGELADFWAIDEIILKDPDYFKKPHPKVFDRTSFVALFLKSIFQLAANGNPKAISNFISIKSSADGEYAEYMDDLTLNLFENHPEVIIGNWCILREYKSSINLETTNYKIKANSIIDKYKRFCNQINANPNVCKEIIDLLKGLAKKN